MRRRTRTAIATLALAAALVGPAACGGRTDGGNPGNPAGDTSSTTSTTVPVVGGS